MLKRIRLYDRIRLTDGTIATINDALADGRVQKLTVWQAQWNETAGNILGYAPKWKTDGSFFRAVERAVRYQRFQGGGAKNANGCRLVRRVAIATPDGERDWGFVSQKVLKPEDHDRELQLYGTEDISTAEEAYRTDPNRTPDRFAHLETEEA